MVGDLGGDRREIAGEMVLSAGRGAFLRIFALGECSLEHLFSGFFPEPLSDDVVVLVGDGSFNFSEFFPLLYIVVEGGGLACLGFRWVEVLVFGNGGIC